MEEHKRLAVCKVKAIVISRSTLFLSRVSLTWLVIVCNVYLTRDNFNAIRCNSNANKAEGKVSAWVLQEWRDVECPSAYRLSSPLTWQVLNISLASFSPILHFV